ncbi:recombinase family protein [Cohnella faecalis]|uniref:Resolvase/invertase-type recombinase catalytic domain-containing protein n=1 Tax=Cohnella faecalis TaxID=2315694 RepID=A0A398CK65_9BACL|nr:recombinase family protein [Cohnella faecalis]RIE03103.1 hypothetical protein D3H35_21245 [Cohnella faecalis]
MGTNIADNLGKKRVASEPITYSVVGIISDDAQQTNVNFAEVFYARVSTEEQAKRGYGLSDQVRRCRKKITELSGDNVEVFEYLEEGVSGEFL